MAYREMLVALPAVVLLLSACVQTPDEVNDSGNESYMNSDYVVALDAYEGARERIPNVGRTALQRGQRHVPNRGF